MRRAFLVTAVLALVAGALPSAAASPSRSPAVGDDMVLIPAGPFLMGGDFDEERPRHRVLLDAFWIDRFEVTNERYAAYLRATGAAAPQYWNKNDRFHAGEKFPRHPVIGISWFEANAFCEWNGKRLPTEAEWEKAARGARDGAAYPWGDVLEKSRANFEGQGTVPVGSYPPSDYGLFDMAGNVWEWVSDWFDPRYYEKSQEMNPPGPESGQDKVLRGGSWVDGSGPNRVAHRHWYPPAHAYKWLGVRCAKSVESLKDSTSGASGAIR